MAGHCCLGTICRAGFLLLSKMDNFAATKKQAILSIPMKFSIIIPVYNRPNEVHELLESLSMQTLKDFEVLIIEDGSTVRCDEVAARYKDKIDVRYYFKPNSGRSLTRNYGMERAAGDYLVFFDSDCVIPPHYFETLTRELQYDYADCYGGPDKAHESFSTLQKAISHSMTSFITTGGIRGGRRVLDHYTPRTFNMGMSMQAYGKVGDFKDMFGEDIDLSLRIQAAGYRTRLIRDAYVYHKRRVSIKSFFRQVNVFGRARIDLQIAHPGSLKLVHTLPAMFVIGVTALLVGSLFCLWSLLPLAVLLLTLFVEALVVTRSLSIASLSVVTSIIQLWGYGCGFISAFFKKIVLGHRDNASELERLYKKK